MANLFFNIPVPAANGSGAPVDVSTAGASKTISVTGPFVASVTIEFTNEVVPTQWAPLVTFNVPDGIVMNAAARWIRATVENYKSGTPECDIGTDDAGTTFATLVAPVGNGVGAAVDVSLLPIIKTVTVGGPFRGNVQIEISEDGITGWSQLGFGFNNPGAQTEQLTARWMRVVRTGVPLIDPGLPLVNVGGCPIGTPGGSSGASVMSSCYIFRPGSGLAGPVVFDSFAALYAALAAERAASNGSGCYSIEFDNSGGGSLEIPAGLYDMSLVSWSNVDGDASDFNQPLSIPMGEGVLITHLLTVRGALRLERAPGGVSSCIRLDDETLTLSGGAGLTGGTSTVLLDVLSSFTGSINLEDNAFIGGGDERQAAVRSRAGSLLTIWMNGVAPGAHQFGSIRDFALDDDVGSGSISIVAKDSDSFYYPTQIYLTNTPVIQQACPMWSFEIDPNGIVSAQLGFLLIQTDPTGNRWRNTDGATAWTLDSSGGGSVDTFTFRPGSGLTGPNVFDDFNALYAAFDAARTAAQTSGKFKIIFDDQDVGGPGSDVILDSGPGNITYDFLYAELIGVHEDVNVNLHVQDGGGEGDSLTIINALWFEGLTVQAPGAQGTPFIANNSQTITLKRTTFVGDGEFVYDFLSVVDCVLHMDDESELVRTLNGAIRVNGNALVIHVTGNRTAIGNLAVSGFVGGSISVLIGSSSAQVDPQQDILLTSFNMLSAQGYWNADPNGVLIGSLGTEVVDQLTGNHWLNTDGATAWSMASGGGIELFNIPAADNGPSPTFQMQTLGVVTDNSQVYVSGQGSTDSFHFDATTNKWITTPPASFTVPWARQFVVNSTSTKAWAISLSNQNVVYIIDVATNTVTGTIPGLPFGAYAAMALNPAGTELWIHNNIGPGQIDRVNAITDTYIASFAAGMFNAQQVCFNPAGNKFYLLGQNALVLGPRLITFDTATFLPIATYSAVQVVRNLVALPDNSEIWFTEDAGPPGVVKRWSVAGDVIVGAPMPVSGLHAGYKLAAKGDSTKVYCLLDNGDIDVFDTGTHTVVNTILTQNNNFGGDLVINPASTFLYTSKTQGPDTGDGQYWVKVISVATELVTDVITYGDVASATPVDLGPINSLAIQGARMSVAGLLGTVELPIVFDDAATYANLKGNRSAEPSINDQTKTGITNIGAAGTVTADYGTVGGGKLNTVSAQYGTVSGGNQNEISDNPADFASIAGGDNNFVDGAYAHIAGGQFNYLFGAWSHAEGQGTDGESDMCHVEGDGTFIDSDSPAAHAEGSGTEIGANSPSAHVEGTNSTIGDDCPEAHCEGRGCFVHNGTPQGHAEGLNTDVGPNILTGHAEGQQCTVLEDYGHAEGFSSLVDTNGFAAHAEGYTTSATALGAHSEGDGSQATGEASHCEGVDGISSGRWSHVEGSVGRATADFAHSEGRVTIASGKGSHAQGILSHASRDGQHAHASGSFQGFAIDEGNAQYSTIILRGETPGAAANEAAVLKYDENDPATSEIILEDDKAYDFTVVCIIGARQAGPVQKTRTIKYNFCARRVAGLSVIAATGAGDAYGDASTATFTLLATVGAAPDRIILTFNTGAGAASRCFVSATVHLSEVRFIPT